MDGAAFHQHWILLVFLQGYLIFHRNAGHWFFQISDSFSRTIGSFYVILDIQKLQYKAAKGTLFVQLTFKTDVLPDFADEKLV